MKKIYVIRVTEHFKELGMSFVNGTEHHLTEAEYRRIKKSASGYFKLVDEYKQDVEVSGMSKIRRIFRP